MAPLVKSFKAADDSFVTGVCITAQHREMLDQVLDFFNIVPDYDLNLMKPGQTLSQITSRVLLELEPVFSDFKPDLIFVQGDTTTVMTGALAAFYKQIPIAHLEAGLRTGNKFSPFPEEINRVLTGHMADWHFAPTDRAVQNLDREGITKQVHQVGNTVIDALLLGLSLIEEKGDQEYRDFFRSIDLDKKIILVTGHRRESFGKPFEEMCDAMATLAREYPKAELVYPVHLNPNVREPVQRLLGDIENIHLIEPLDYPYLIWLMNKSFLVLTDSGGIQEEAPTLGKPVLVMRDVTERQEGVDAGTAKLVGTNKDKILSEARKLLDDPSEYKKMANAVNPYGDGTTSQRIVDILRSDES